MEAKLNDNAMTTAEDIEEFLGMDPKNVPPATKNNLIRLINAASDYVESMTGRKFRKQRYIEQHASAGYQQLCMKEYPIVEIASIRDTGNDKVLDPASYSWQQDGDIGIVYMDSGWPARGYPAGLSGDISLLSRYLEVDYIAGYILPKDATEEEPATLPGDLQWIIWQIVQQQWNLAQNGANGLSAFSISDVSWTFDKELSSQVQSVIDRYTRYG